MPFSRSPQSPHTGRLLVMSCSMNLLSGQPRFLRGSGPGTGLPRPTGFDSFSPLVPRYRVSDDEFRPVAGFLAYRVNRHGEVQTCRGRTVPKGLTETWLPLKSVRRGRDLTVNLGDGVKKVARHPPARARGVRRPVPTGFYLLPQRRRPAEQPGRELAGASCYRTSDP